jgi:hypothetical protein
MSLFQGVMPRPSLYHAASSNRVRLYYSLFLHIDFHLRPVDFASHGELLSAGQSPIRVY